MSLIYQRTHQHQWVIQSIWEVLGFFPPRPLPDVPWAEPSQPWALPCVDTTSHIPRF